MLTREQRRHLEDAQREIARLLESGSPSGLRKEANALFLCALRSAAHYGDWMSIPASAHIWIATHALLLERAARDLWQRTRTIEL